MEGLAGVRVLALGGLHALAVRAGGRVAAWGANQNGALGLPSGAPADLGQPTLLEDLRCEQVPALCSRSLCFACYVHCVAVPQSTANAMP